MFDLRKIDLNAFARSFGLASAPVINFKGAQKDDEDQEDEDQPKLTKIEKLRMKQKLKKQAIKEAKIKTKQVNV